MTNIRTRDVSDQFRKISIRHKHIGYNLNVMLQSAYLVINPITVDSFAPLFLLHAGESGVRLYDYPDLKLFMLIGWDRSSFVCCFVHLGSTDDLLLQISSGGFWQSRDIKLSCNMLYLLGVRLCFFDVLNSDLFIYCDDSLTS